MSLKMNIPVRDADFEAREADRNVLVSVHHDCCATTFAARDYQTAERLHDEMHERKVQRQLARDLEDINALLEPNLWGDQ